MRALASSQYIVLCYYSCTVYHAFNYDSAGWCLHGWHTACRFGVVIADEAHYLKNKDSARAKALLPVLQSSVRTILLTGTPALNCPAELWTLVSTLRPDIFDNWQDYADHFCERPPCLSQCNAHTPDASKWR